MKDLVDKFYSLPSSPSCIKQNGDVRPPYVECIITRHLAIIFCQLHCVNAVNINAV